MCQSLAARAGCCTQWCHLPVILPAPSPTLPHCSCAAGVARNWEAHDTFALILHAFMSLLPPTITTQYIKNMASAYRWIHSLHLLQFSSTQQNQCQPSLFTHKKHHLKTALHSPFITNGKSKCQARSNLSCGPTLVQKLHHNTQSSELRGEGVRWRNQVTVLLCHPVWV